MPVSLRVADSLVGDPQAMRTGPVDRRVGGSDDPAPARLRPLRRANRPDTAASPSPEPLQRKLSRLKNRGLSVAKTRRRTLPPTCPRDRGGAGACRSLNPLWMEQIGGCEAATPGCAPTRRTVPAPRDDLGFHEGLNDRGFRRKLRVRRSIPRQSVQSNRGVFLMKTKSQCFWRSLLIAASVPVLGATVDVTVTGTVVFNGIAEPAAGRRGRRGRCRRSRSRSTPTTFVDGIPGDTRGYVIDHVVVLRRMFEHTADHGAPGSVPARRNGRTSHWSRAFPSPTGSSWRTATVSPGGVALEQEPFNLNHSLGYVGATLRHAGHPRRAGYV